MKTIVSYPERGTGGKSSYRGNCTPHLIEDLIKYYKPSSISDYSCGSGTVEDVASQMKIKSYCYDLNRGFDLITDEIKERNDFIFYHPAYWDVIKYSGSQYGSEPLKNDISHIPDYNEFIKMLNFCIMKQFSSLKMGGRMAVLVGDIKKNKKLYSMILDMIKPGTIEQIIIKEQHNTWSSNQSYNGKFIPIVHEYLIVFRRDDAFIGSCKVSKDVQFDLRDSIHVTWKDLIASVFESQKSPLSLKQLYEIIENHQKAKTNSHYKEKIRQVLNAYDIFVKCDRGTYGLSYLNQRNFALSS